MTSPAQITNATYGIWEQSAWESITLPVPGRGDASLTVERCRLTWRPSPAIAAALPADLRIEFEVDRGADGNRRFVPVGGFGPYIQNAWLAGLGILRCIRNLSAEEAFSHRALKLVFDRVRAGREHLTRSFSASRDLYVRPKGRGGNIEASLLPETVGRTADGKGHSWSIRELTERGRAAAQDDGIVNPTGDVAIRYGLTLAAQRNPLADVEEAGARSLIIQALFDDGELHTAVTDATVDDVTERLLVALEEHGEDTWKNFAAWFSGRKNNLVQTLARKKGFPKLSREVVKRALLKLGWRSYQYVAVCLSLFAQAVRRDLPEPLNEEERRRFEAMYLPQVGYGGLPLVLLLERSDLIGLIVTRLWETPEDPALVGALHRLLEIYAALAPARRSADRRFKALKAAFSKKASPHAPKFDLGRLRTLVHRLLQARGAGCPCAAESNAWNLTVDAVDETSVTVTVSCDAHELEHESEFTLAELMKTAEQIADDEATAD